MAKKAAKALKQKGRTPAVKYPRIDERAAENFVSLQEIVATARRNLSPALWDHLSGGSDSETTLWRNRQALDGLALRQRVLVDEKNRHHDDAARAEALQPRLSRPGRRLRRLRASPGRL